MKNRPARVRELIQRELGALIAREMTFDATLVTVQSVDLSADFKHCHVHVGVMGTAPEQRDALQLLGERRRLLQAELSKRVILKYTPQLHFHLDTSVERGTKVMEIMRQVDALTPPESAEAAARRRDAYAEGDTEEIGDLEDLDAAEADTEPTVEEETAEEDAVYQEPVPAPAKAAEKVRVPRSVRDHKGRGKQTADDDE